MDTLTTQQDFSEVLQQIQQARQKAFTQANTALIDLYWHIGKTISHKVQTQALGKGVVSELARYIAQSDSSLKGFRDKNLWRMKQFYETYQADEKLVLLVWELPWTHNLIILSRCKTLEERAYYLKLTLADKLSKRELYSNQFQNPSFSGWIDKRSPEQVAYPVIIKNSGFHSELSITYDCHHASLRMAAQEVANVARP